MSPVSVLEATIEELRAALGAGRVTSEDLVNAYQERILAYDRSGPRLNSIVVDNPDALVEARASDARRRRGYLLGSLEGIPYTAKDSYQAWGLTVAAGSPAFERLVAQRDAFTIHQLRQAGAILLGLTNMPPMANGGMQRGLYGRAESPYSLAFLTSAYASGSSNGSGTATAASFAAFGLGGETWSSGRAPASNNGLCAYTPSRGVISMRGTWPLVPTMDVVVPHTRTMGDLFEVLDVIVEDDPHTRGDFWRTQPWIHIPPSSALRPHAYGTLAVSRGAHARHVLTGKRLGIPGMYINSDPRAGTNEHGGIGGPTGQRIETRLSVVDLWESARRDLEAAGAEVVDLPEFPVVSNYESDRPDAPSIVTRGLVSPEYLCYEVGAFSACAWQDFLEANGDPGLNDLSVVDGSLIFPQPVGALPDRYHGFVDDIAAYPAHVRDCGTVSRSKVSTLEAGLKGLERTREVDFDDWMAALALDAVVFPAVADIGPADADVDETSAAKAWRNGVWVANGNLVLRHLGIPTVTVPMGTMADTGMPVGLTFAGRAWEDSRLLQLAAAFEATGDRRTSPRLTPPLGDDPVGGSDGLAPEWSRS